jgi:ferredoxin
VSPTIRILLKDACSELSVVARSGERVLDLLDEEGSLSTRFSCRSASCGVCLVRVKSGAAALRPSSESERETLAELEANPDERLLCQIVLETDEDVVFEL